MRITEIVCVYSVVVICMMIPGSVVCLTRKVPHLKVLEAVYIHERQPGVCIQTESFTPLSVFPYFTQICLVL